MHPQQTGYVLIMVFFYVENFQENIGDMGYSTKISNLIFFISDKLNEFQIEIMKRGGNKILDGLGEENQTGKLSL